MVANQQNVDFSKRLVAYNLSSTLKFGIIGFSKHFAQKERKLYPQKDLRLPPGLLFIGWHLECISLGIVPAGEQRTTFVSLNQSKSQTLQFEIALL